VSFPFDLHSAAVPDSHLPCYALTMPFFSWPRHVQSMVWARHGKCESDTAALCKSNGKETFYTLSGTAWQGNGMLYANWP